MSVSYHQPEYRKGRWARRARRLGLLAVLALTSMGLAQAGGSPTTPAYAVPTATATAAPEPPPVLFGCLSTTGEQTYQAPAGVNVLHVVVNGGSGEGDNLTDPAHGAQVTADIAVAPGDTLAIVVGCGATGRSGAAGFSDGGDGGSSGVQESGGGGGGSSAILHGDGTPILVAGGGGGIGGGSGLASSASGGAGSLQGQDGNSGHGSGSAGHGRGGGHWRAPGPNGQNGYGSRGGGGGGGGAGGYPNGGSGARGGSCFGCGGGGGGGGQSYAGSGTTQANFISGGAPVGDGSVLIVPALAGQPAPSWSIATCNGSGTVFNTPTNVYALQVIATGASGGAEGVDNIPGGLGAEVQATIATIPGAQYNVVAGCASSGQLARSGYGRSGDGGSGSSNNENGAAGGGGSALLLGSQPIVVAGGGGGAGGVGDDAATPGAGGAGSQNGDRGGDSSGGAGGAGGGAGGHNGVGGGSGAGGGGGGGGGYHGGNGGHSGRLHSGGGGGGGSSYVSPAATNVSIQDGTAPRGDGEVIIEWTAPSAPGAPMNVVATPSTAAATISFTPPSYDGGAPITAYTVTASPGGATATGTSSPLTVSGLTPGATYTFTVFAANGIGTGPASAPSAAVRIPTTPGAPTGVSATWVAGQVGQVAVSFTPPSDNGGAPITSYTLSSSVGGTLVTSPASVGTTIIMGGLVGQIPYTFTVRATNLAGDGPRSAPSAPLTLITAPSPPLYPSATAHGNQALVRFLAPLDSGGSPVLDYTITSSPGGVTVTGNPYASGEEMRREATLAS